MLLQPVYRTRVSKGLIAWWPFDGGGNPRNAPISGSPGNVVTLISGTKTTTYASGFAPPTRGTFKGSLLIPGDSNCYGDAGADSSLNPAAVSILMWVKINSFPNAYGALCVRADAGQSNYYAFLIKSTGKLAPYIGVGGSFAAIDPANTAVATGVWTHVALTYSNAGGLDVYYNGISDGANQAGIGAINSFTGTCFIGAQQNQTRYIDAYVDDVRIYNRKLSSAEVFAVSREAYQPWLDIETIALMQVSASVADVLYPQIIC
jgi:hypothetical protein